MMNRFFWSDPPPKEGQTRSYRFKNKKLQRFSQSRVLFSLLLIAAIFLLSSQFLTTDGDLDAGKFIPEKENVKKFSAPKKALRRFHLAPPLAQMPVELHESSHDPFQNTPNPASEIELDSEQQEPRGHSLGNLEFTTAEAEDYRSSLGENFHSHHHTEDHEIPFPESEDINLHEHQFQAEDSAAFEAKLQKVIGLLPDEVNARELLSEPKGTGKERLREIGLRTRAFQKFFDAWEDLHLVFNDVGDEVRVRDDIIQSMRTTLSLDGEVLANTIHAYEQFRSFFHNLSRLLFPWTSPYWSDHVTLHSHFWNGGRGIVLSGGDIQAPYLLTSVQTLRQLGCELPIEIMYLGDSDLDEDYRQQLEELPGVVTRDMSQMISDEGWKVLGWAGKPFALLMSSFREVIFIDADSLFFEDPNILFSDPGYVKTGALFFRDRKIMPENKKRWLQQLLPKPISKQAKQSYMWNGESGHYQESGVVVVDKWRHFVSMLLVTRMNGPDRDGNKEKGIVGVYDMVYGDKETYWLAWELAGDLGYSFHQGAAGIMGKINGTSEDAIPTRLSTQDRIRLKAAHPYLTDEQIDNAFRRSIEIAEAAAAEQPTNYTICAPQLLHLQLDGSPLWFNGWIMAKKEIDKRLEVFNSFERYSAEPKQRGPGKQDAWKLLGSNVCCLTTEETFEFTDRQRKVLDMIVQVAQDVRRKEDPDSIDMFGGQEAR